jgi:phosphatidylinositol alpha-mannosyltransferase
MSRVVLAANNADIGGGEVMLLATAAALHELGVRVAVVGPTATGGVLDAAAEHGFEVHRLGAGRRDYVRRLRAWAARSDDWLWCQGLVPSFSTSGRRRRIVHLHQEPGGAHRVAARAARTGAAVVLVPSHDLQRRVPGSRVLWNWTAPQHVLDDRAPSHPTRIGFIGRHSTDKGLDLLAHAVRLLDAAEPGRWRLSLAGDGRFVPPAQTRAVAEALAPVEHLVDRLGWCEREHFQAVTDLAVYPSRWAEPFGLVAAESMSARQPFVVSDAGALPEVVGPEHPWVARHGDPEALAEAVSACVGSSEPARVAALDTARRRWVEHFSPDAGRARVADLVRTLGIIG